GAKTAERSVGIGEILEGEDACLVQRFYLLPHLWAWSVQGRRTSSDWRRRWYVGLYRLYWFLGIDVALHLIIKFMVSFMKSARLVRFYYRHILPPAIMKNVTIVDLSDKTLVMEHELFRHLEIEIFVAGG